ncbi:hypothetical protein ACE01N_20085 [Saccharicrinis sp. FJH2]|uniref:hypothetical protein n=1 Tax=Saccharicrinis sp. FJH65 TaxID=3344659 RepID=UPI0035F2E4B1
MITFRNFILIIVIFVSKISVGQSLNYRIEFFINQILTDGSSQIITKNGSTEIYDLFINKQNGFDYKRCLFIDNKYYSDSIWNELLTNKDIEYISKQIDEYKNFKWKSDRLPKNVILYSKCKGKKYSRKAMKSFNRKTADSFEIITMNHYSLPLFNLKENFAIIYCGHYSGPMSASASAEIYLKIDGNWERIGTYLHSIS